MVAIDIIQERGRPAPNWAEVSGIYADLSGWPRRGAQFYVKCPKCGVVHGNYKSLRDAHAKRLCQGCDIKVIHDIKDLVAHVDDPGRKPKSIARILGEDTPPLPDEPGFSARDELLSLGGNWLINAKLELEERENVSLEFRDPNEDLHANPDSVEQFTLEGTTGYLEYTVYKNEELAEQAALNQVKQDLEDSPENFNASWLQSYIDEDDLRRAIGDPYDDWEGDLEGKDVPETIEFLYGEGKLDEETFYTKTGRLRKITRRTQEILDAAVDEYKEESKPTFDPWEYLEEMHGNEGRETYGLTTEQKKAVRLSNVVKAACDLVNIDIDRAAHDAIRADGWQHFLAHYDNNSIELEMGVVAVRIN